MINKKVFGMMLMVAAIASILVVTTTSSHDAMASILDADVDEAALAGNTTMTNQTTDGNMNGTNSIS